MLQYRLTNTTPHTIDEQVITHGLAAAAKTAGLTEDRFVSIEIVSGNESRAANKALRGHDEPTDCISIPTQETQAGEQVITQASDGELHFEIHGNNHETHNWPALGQLIVCYYIVAKNAELAGQPVTRELEWVIEHGILHLLGYHHDE